MVGTVAISYSEDKVQKKRDKMYRTSNCTCIATQFTPVTDRLELATTEEHHRPTPLHLVGY